MIDKLIIVGAVIILSILIYLLFEIKDDILK